MKKIVVIGSSNTDLVARTERFPLPGQTLLGGKFNMTAGGKGANQAVAVARLGGDLTFIACVGDDVFGRNTIDNFKKENMDVSRIEVIEGTPSGVALIEIDSNAENTIVVASGANECMTKEHIDKNMDIISNAGYMLLQLETPMDVVEYAASRGKASGCRVVLNPAPAAALSEELLANIFLITPNETEAGQICGMELNADEDVERAAKAIRDMGVENVVITLGARGSYVQTAEIAEFVPALKVQAVDTVAAGDTFNGALCVAMGEGQSLLDAVRFATRASAIAVTREGAQTSIPLRKELD